MYSNHEWMEVLKFAPKLEIEILLHSKENVIPIKQHDSKKADYLHKCNLIRILGHQIRLIQAFIENCSNTIISNCYYDSY